MKALALTFYSLFIFFSADAQRISNAIEIQPLFRYDTYPEFSYAINSISTNKVKIQGKSYGILTAYRYALPGNIKVKLGIGYYRYSFNSIKSFNSSYGEGSQRVIIYPNGGDMIYTTNKYWYHNICLSAGLEKYFIINRQIDLFAGAHLHYYQTFRQFYKINNSKSYVKHDGRNFGFGGAFHVGVSYKMARFSIEPQIVIPIYDQWQKDKVFPGEVNNSIREKWFKGYGMAIGIGYALMKNK